eukprot:Protomagalhaensia_sp_Gyna_25__3571@NODE_320_length_3889_cov_66_442857_g250_i0_p3_GENE_NODE_320_length_3889_cov_66_442857_g250_i0NODE_320_length_3889_cov_66_442857_g250_i0_p3_ORF_typecomplete_len207_score45_38Phosducin/PF02114_16/3_5e22Thioredoxin/PF00085_20/0_016Antimicrobial_1/PF08018_11/1_5e03Antimicrobial_1/PF08018_11/0_28DUF4175/PF13779_6/1Sds3/PF08598_11/2_6OmpH/PF03938_14/13_NODE_320_length_3889_cov_66_442857_g250_i08951515
MTPVPPAALNAAQQKLATQIAEGLSKAMEAKEDEINREMEQLDNMDEDDIEVLRQKRKLELMRASKARELWRQRGHGEYSEVFDEMEFFTAAKGSPKLVCHFYKPETNIERKEIVDKHLKILCREFMNIRFICANVERLPFITARLRIYVLPSIILIKEKKMFHTMVGFEELGRSDTFTTKELARVLEQHGMMEHFDPDWRPKEED